MLPGPDCTLSLQTILGKGDKFYGLLEQSAATVCESASTLSQFLTKTDRTAVKGSFAATRACEKELASQISEGLINTFVTALDREDIEALNSALYQITETIEKFAERYEIMFDHLAGVDLAQRAEVLQRSSEVVAKIIAELRRGWRTDPVKKLRDRLQPLESEGQRMLLAPYRTLYLESTDAMRPERAKDLFELIEKAIDKCHDVGNFVYPIVLGKC